MELNPNDAENIYYAVLAGIGGVLGYLYRELNARRKLSLKMLILSGTVAAFIGYHMIFIYNEFNMTDNVKGALNGLSAFLGVEFMLYLVRKFLTKFSNTVQDKDLHEALLTHGAQTTSSNSGDSDGDLSHEGAKPK